PVSILLLLFRARPPSPTLFPYTTLFRSGSYTNSSGQKVTLAERWNGRTWAVQSTPNPRGAQSSSLSGVSCPSSTLCVAVGSYTRSEEHTSELQSRVDLVCRLLLEKETRE